MTITTEYEFGKILYLKTDREQLPRMFVAVKVSVSGGALYCLGCGANESWHYEIEITTERDVLLAVT